MFATLFTSIRMNALHRDWTKTARCHFHYGRPEHFDVTASEDGEIAESLAISPKGLVWGAQPHLAIPIEEGLDLLARNKSERLVSIVYSDL